MEENQDKKHEFYPMETTVFFGNKKILKGESMIWSQILNHKNVEQNKAGKRSCSANPKFSLNLSWRQNDVFASGLNPINKKKFSEF